RARRRRRRLRPARARARSPRPRRRAAGNRAIDPDRRRLSRGARRSRLVRSGLNAERRPELAASTPSRHARIRAPVVVYPPFTVTLLASINDPRAAPTRTLLEYRQ